MALLLLAVLMQSGCGKLPRPFQTQELEEKQANNLLAIRSGRGVLVAVPEGAPDDLVAQGLAEDLKEGLHRLDVLASTDAEKVHNLILSGLLDHDGQTVRLAWVLRDYNDITRGKGVVAAKAGDADWRQGREGLLEDLSGQVAAKVAQILKPAAYEAASKAVEVKQARVAVTEVIGAPGDGNLSLARSLRHHLRTAGLPFTEDSGQAAVHVSGMVSLEPLDGRTDAITLTWIFSKPEGGELARINQSNQIPHGSLDGRWGDTAFEVTSALVAAVRQTLVMLHEQSSLSR
ncbi:hypothetical protein [Aestuariispira insulae]|uniref:hypothetical protein n=1 Tax=Aestuariispira insulae TaxID=1461337 RepID=UPI0011C03FD9|nr:hypothetical protein [Aestuariispira insulae]